MSDEAWTVWALDTFDRESPPRADDRGVGLRAGLAALWRRVLREGVRDDGGGTFTSFQLEWPGGTERLYNWEVWARPRAWAYGTPGPYQSADDDGARIDARERGTLIEALAAAHARLLAAGVHDASERLRACVFASRDAGELEAKLSEL